MLTAKKKHVFIIKYELYYIVLIKIYIIGVDLICWTCEQDIIWSINQRTAAITIDGLMNFSKVINESCRLQSYLQINLGCITNS